MESELPEPTEQHWRDIEKQFANRWNFPNCVGALDGKHILVTKPFNSNSQFHNYKGTFSMCLMALCDANYKFTFVDIGQYGSNADEGVFQRSVFGSRFLRRELGIPPPKQLENAAQLGMLPHCIIADEAFPLHIDLMCPYPHQNENRKLPQDKAIFNYRLSRARHIVENCFGIFAQRWRIFMQRIQLDPEIVTEVIKACCVLHNFLRETPEYRDRGTLRVNDDGTVVIPQGGPMVNVAYLSGYHSAKDALQTREIFKNYFNSPEGSVPWQVDILWEQ